MTAACVKTLYSTVGGNELPPNLNRRCTPEKASIMDASRGLMHFKRSTGGQPSLCGFTGIGQTDL